MVDGPCLVAWLPFVACDLILPTWIREVETCANAFEDAWINPIKYWS